MDRLKQMEQEGCQQRLTLWAERIRECRASGITVVDWCRQNGFSQKTYYYWMRKVKRELVDALPEHRKCRASSINPMEKSIPPPNGWAICEVMDEKTSYEKKFGESVTVEIGKCRIDVTNESNVELLGKVLKVLVALC
jgi:hypothetical protein